jgi:hypothetical protein
LSEGTLLGQPFSIENFFQVRADYSTAFELSDLIDTNSFSFYKDINNHLIGIVYTKDANTKVTMDLNIFAFSES